MNSLICAQNTILQLVALHSAEHKNKLCKQPWCTKEFHMYNGEIFSKFQLSIDD